MLKNDRKYLYWMHGGLFVAALLAPWLPARADTQAADPSAAPVEAMQGAAVSAARPWEPMLLAAQYNGIHQHLDSFGAAYSGPLSLPAAGDDATSQTFGAYFGMAMPAHWAAYLDIERFTGGGVGNATGLASPTNGDVVRAGNGLPKDAYIARAYVQYLLPLGDDVTAMGRAQDQLPGEVPTSALLFKVGKLAVGDDFDQNRYANNTRTEFETWTLINNGAYDYAADTRGYTGGLVFGYLQPGWSLKFGLYRMSQQANQEALEWPLNRAHGDNLELDLMPNDSGTVIRFLVYRNVARMGIYQNAINQALVTGGKPDVAADDADGREKHGFGFNLEQPLADGGDSGVFLRLGWNDGQTETFEFTEVDRTLSLGGQLSGAHWGREDDRLGVAMVINGISAVHQRYLELGGCGFELCDGTLSYGHEEVLETYYRFQLGSYAQLSPDIQYFQNPGYNRDRGPARVYGLRLHLQY
ncbi:MAG TPA: carbohydrate porin [Gammaproteobacteria bacterium]|nr:carbohydrate porin [Gammaproteobacteria bacterium]